MIVAISCGTIRFGSKTSIGDKSMMCFFIEDNICSHNEIVFDSPTKHSSQVPSTLSRPTHIVELSAWLSMLCKGDLGAFPARHIMLTSAGCAD